jgi:heme exporter protein D
MRNGLELDEDPMESEAPDNHPPLGRLPAWVKWSAIAIAIASAILLLVHSEGAERRAILDLPAAERQALLARTVQNLKSICSPADDAMRNFCSGQARFALELPECDKACQELADRQLSRVQMPR